LRELGHRADRPCGRNRPGWRFGQRGSNFNTWFGSANFRSTRLSNAWFAGNAAREYCYSACGYRNAACGKFKPAESNGTGYDVSDWNS
jgi:hypothetical protein